MRKMRVGLVAMVAWLVLGLQTAIADTEVSGNIIHDRTWTVEGSPYIVVGTVVLYPKVTLTIEPGVNIKFNDSLYLAIYGELIARGTVTDSILFTSNSVTPQPGDWGGISFVDSSADAVLDTLGNYVSGCIIKYCRIEYGTGILCNDASPFISHNAITGNTTADDGGGIYLYSSSPTISGNTITGNSTYHGGGIYCFNSSSIVTGNTITGNSAYYEGGGIWCEFSSPTITGNTITGNSASGDGGGICCYNYSSPIITGNTIARNSASSGNGGGIYCYYSSPTIANNAIIGNSASSGGGILCGYSNSTIAGNTITGNSASSAGGGIYNCQLSDITITDNIIAGNSASSGGGIQCNLSNSTITGNTITGNSASWNVGGIYCYDSSSATINYNNIVNEGQYEIYLDNTEYSIDATNNWWGTTNIDSIDAKIWDYYDDMALGKVLYNPFLTSPYGIRECNDLQIAMSFSLSQNYPNPFNPVTEIRYALPGDCQVKLEVYNILGEKVATLVDETQSPGYKAVTWNAKDVGSGVYFYRLQAGSFVESKRMVVIK